MKGQNKELRIMTKLPNIKYFWQQDAWHQKVYMNKSAVEPEISLSKMNLFNNCTYQNIQAIEMLNGLSHDVFNMFFIS